MEITIIIVNYNVKYFLEQCLYAVEKACGNIRAEIFVVDNASTDDSKLYFEGKFSQVKFLWQTKNTGFAKANNAALSRAQGEYVLFLNPDTIIAENTLETCLAFARRQLKFGALGVSMIDGSGNYLPESKRMFPSLSASFYKMSGIANIFPGSPYFSKYYAAHIHPYHSGEVEVLAGAFMMVSKKVLDITGGFDEAFFMYGEDIDLSYRIRKAGYKNYYCGETSIIHFKGESIQKESKSYLKNFYGAMFLFVNKHGKGQKAHVKAGILAAYALARMKQGVLQLKPESKFPDDNALAIVAGDEVFNRMLQLLKLSVVPFMIKGRVGIHESDVDHTLGHFDGIKAIVSKHKITHLVLAEGELSFKKIIDLIRENKNMVSYLIHANNSKSIVGSSDKNKSGFYIAEAG